MCLRHLRGEREGDIIREKPLTWSGDVRALLDELRWHAEGKAARQPERGKREFLRRLLARQTPVSA